MQVFLLGPICSSWQKKTQNVAPGDLENSETVKVFSKNQEFLVATLRFSSPKKGGQFDTLCSYSFRGRLSIFATANLRKLGRTPTAYYPAVRVDFFWGLDTVFLGKNGVFFFIRPARTAHKTEVDITSFQCQMFFFKLRIFVWKILFLAPFSVMRFPL